MLFLSLPALVLVDQLLQQPSFSKAASTMLPLLAFHVYADFRLYTSFVHSLPLLLFFKQTESLSSLCHCFIFSHIT